jgi:hypothetical protein
MVRTLDTGEKRSGRGGTTLFALLGQNLHETHVFSNVRGQCPLPAVALMMTVVTSHSASVERCRTYSELPIPALPIHELG